MKNDKGQNILVVLINEYTSKEKITEVCEDNFQNYPEDYPEGGYKLCRQLPSAIKKLGNNQRIFLIKKSDLLFTLNEILID